MKVAELLVQMLETAGVEYIFGIPGGAIEDLNVALYHNGSISVIVAKHEQGAAYMADGFARVSGNLGVCFATAGPGASNLITGLATSFADSVPVCALTGQVAVSVFGKGAFQDSGAEGVNMVSIFRNFTKYSAMLPSEHRAEYLIQKVIRLAKSPPSGPVHLSLPVDVMKRPVEIAAAGPSRAEGRRCDREGARLAAEHLVAAKRPAIIAGWGVTLSKGAGALKELAQLLHMPVATSPKGKGVFPENHPLSLGVMGFAGTPVAREYLLENEVDVLLAVGTSFNEMMTSGWDDRLHPSCELIHIDVDVEKIGKNYPASIGLVGDARATLREISHIVKSLVDVDTSYSRGAPAEPMVAALREKHLPPTGMPQSSNSAYHPQHLVADIQAHFPKNSMYFVDIGNVMAWGIRHLCMEVPYSFFLSLGFGGMGYATAAPVGAKLAAPERPVVALVGDGSFLMNGMEVATAVNYRIPVVWIVFNNAMHGMIYHGRRMFEEPVPEGIPSEFKRGNLAQVAGGLGALGVVVKEAGGLTCELVDKVLASGQPAVIDVWIDREAVPPIGSRIESVVKHFQGESSVGPV